MIYFAELFMTGGQHAAFNAAMLEVLIKAFPHHRINIFAEDSHYQQMLKKGRGKSQLSWTAVKVIPNKSGSNARWLFKYINELLQILRVLILARFRNVELVYFAFLSPLGQYVVSQYLRYFRQKRLQVIITLHGLDILIPSKPKKRVDKLYTKLLKRAFAFSAACKKYVVLEERVAKYLIEKKYLQVNEIIQLSHPYQFDTNEKGKASAPIIFAHLGVARLDKQSHLFFELAASYSSMIEAGEIIFQVIGPILPEMKPYLNQWVQYQDTEGMLGIEKYQHACMNAHYAVFFYDESNYALTSSGAVLDAISFNMPILALEGSVFDPYLSLQKEFPGKLYITSVALQQDLINIIQNHPRDYTQLQQSFVALQKHYSTDRVAQLVRQQVTLSE